MRKHSALFFLILVCMTSVSLFVAADYGESSDSLGQFTDEFSDLDNVSVRVNVIRNSTYNAMELNTSAGGGQIFFDGFEANNLDLWTSSNNWATGNAYEKTGTYGAEGWGSTSLLTKLLGAHYSDNVEFSYWIRPILYRSYSFLRDDATTVTYIYHRADTNTFYAYTGSPVIIAAGCPEGNWYNVYVDDINFGTDTYDVHIYDASMNLKGSVNNVAFPADKSYISEITFQAGTGSSGRAWLDDVNLTSGGGPVEGYFTTTDYLDYANGSILALLTNSTIPENTGITVEFSEDNATWTLNDWEPIFGGFESIDLRELNWSSSCFLRYNLTTTDPEITPRVYQSRLITTEGARGPGENVTGVWEFYNITEVGVLVGTLDAGTLASLAFVDGDMYNVSEVVGAPGILISLNVTGINPDSESVWLLCYHLYDGNQAHDFDKEVWNFTDSSWLEFSHFDDGVVFEFNNATVYALRVPSEFLSGGEMRFLFDHEAAGNINHDLFLDYVRVLAHIPSDVIPSITLITESDFPWIAIAIILMCVAYLLTRYYD